jgi:hypothetical protein
MPQPRYYRQRDDASGLIFVFRYDPDAPELLHIFARHATVPDDAIDAFFEGADDTTWNDQRRRFETYSADYGLYWFWLEPQRVVMVITCFRL